MSSPAHVVVERLLHEGVEVATADRAPDSLPALMLLLHVDRNVVRRVEHEAAHLTRVLLRGAVRRLAVLAQVRPSLEAARALGALEEDVVSGNSEKIQNNISRLL